MSATSVVLAAFLLATQGFPAEDSLALSISNTSQNDQANMELLDKLYGGAPKRAIIVHGVLSTPKSRTYMALIGYGPADSKVYRCAGSVITSRFILSAARCAQVESLGPAKWAHVGDLDLSTTIDDAKTQGREIIERIVHPGYREPQVYNDIALFRLDRNLDFDPWVQPLCLHRSRDIPEGPATIAGWGRADLASPWSDHLLEAEIDVFNDTECQRLHPTKNIKTPRGIDPEIMFCAGQLDGSKDGCLGEFGSALIVPMDEHCFNVQIGITSYGNICGLPDSPGVYTRVSHFVSWIEDILYKYFEI